MNILSFIATDPAGKIFADISIALFSLLLGSFFNVLIFRIPRDESIVFPGSHCPHCNRLIKPWENIPVLSYIIIGGRCAGCHANISPRYPFVEILTSLFGFSLWRLMVLPAWITGDTWGLASAIIPFFTLLFLIPIAFIDLDHYIIPDEFTIPGILVGFLASWIPGGLSPLMSLAGIAAGGGVLLAVGFAGEFLLKKKDAMGWGDIKLMAFLGACLGWKSALLGIFFGSFIGAAAGLILILFKKLPDDHRIPFGPFLGSGTIIAVLFGETIITGYLTLVQSLFFP